MRYLSGIRRSLTYIILSICNLHYVADLPLVNICNLSSTFHRYFCIRRSLTYIILPIRNLHSVADLLHKKYMPSLFDLSQLLVYSPISHLQYIADLEFTLCRRYFTYKNLKYVHICIRSLFEVSRGIPEEYNTCTIPHLYCRDRGQIPRRFVAGRPIEGRVRPVQRKDEKKANIEKGKKRGR